MVDFTYSNPTKVLFGRDSEMRLVEEMSHDGVKKVLVVSGQGSAKRSGLLDKIETALSSRGIDVIAWSGVSANPLLSHVYGGIEAGREAHVDAILAIGGGSVIDEGKAIAAGIGYEGDVWDFFERKAVITQALRVYTILTLAATGSESNGNSVVTKSDEAKKYNIVSPYLYPKASALNPLWAMSVPAAYVAYSAVDAISHVIEGYFTKENCNPLVDRLCESVIKTVMESAEAILADPSSYDAQAQFMWASSLALNGSLQVGLEKYSFPNHIIELPLSAYFNLAHGAGLAIVIPAWMRWYVSRNRTQFERFAREIFGLLDADAGIDALEAWFVKIKAPVSLQSVGIDEEAIPKLAQSATELARLRGGLEKVYTVDVVSEILKGAL